MRRRFESISDSFMREVHWPNVAEDKRRDGNVFAVARLIQNETNDSEVEDMMCQKCLWHDSENGSDVCRSCQADRSWSKGWWLLPSVIFGAAIWFWVIVPLIMRVFGG